MDEFLFLFLVLIIPILIVAGIIFLSFWLPKKLGFPKAGKIIGVFTCCFFIYTVVAMIFEDELFSKNDARELLEEQKVYLNDDFKLEENSSNWAIGDYYHSFTLSISEKDKNRIIEEIKTASNYKDSSVQVTELLYVDDERKVNVKYFQNYETNTSYVKEYIEENGEGYAPTFRQIYVDKKENELRFIEIDE